MKTTFTDYLNEYGGPNKSIGFSYPNRKTEEYTLNLGILINPDYNLNHIHRIIENILKQFNVGEDWFEINKEDKKNKEDYLYILRIALKAYNELEIESLKHLLEKELKNYPNEIVVAPLYGIEGDEIVKKKIGYRND